MNKLFSHFSPHIHSWIVIFALISALFFSGTELEYLSIALILLFIWLISNVLSAYTADHRIHKSAISISLCLFWIWLAVSLIWSIAPSNSILLFWWISIFPLVFFSYQIETKQNQFWERIRKAILAIGILLALYGIYQYFAWGVLPLSVFLTRNTHAAFLNLIAVPASAYFLINAPNKNFSTIQKYLSSLILFILFFSIALTNSRGGMLSLIIALAILIWLIARHVARRSVVMLLAILLLGVIAATLVPLMIPEYSEGGLIATSRELHDPSSRLMIWKPAWEMLKTSPWFGIGLGTYYLAWPPYKDPSDTTAGIFVHNDYLQIWIETGLPGLLLLLLLMGSLVWSVSRITNKSNIEPQTKIEIVGLFCGLLVVALHSFVDFNFYIPSILLVAGLILGRFQTLVGQQLNTLSIEIRPEKFIGKKLYLLASALLLTPMLYFTAIGLGGHYSGKALAQAKQGLLEEANKSFMTAKRFAPNDDRIYTGHADLYRQTISQLPMEDADNKKLLFMNALHFLDNAKQINPYRWETPVVRGKIYSENPDLAGEKWRTLAADSFHRALSLNPKLYKTRIDYATLLLSDGKFEPALGILDAGISYTYINNPDLAIYYAFTIVLLKESGRYKEAKQLEERLIQLQKRLARSQEPNTLYGY